MRRASDFVVSCILFALSADAALQTTHLRPGQARNEAVKRRLRSHSYGSEPVASHSDLSRQAGPALSDANHRFLLSRAHRGKHQKRASSSSAAAAESSDALHPVAYSAEPSTVATLLEHYDPRMPPLRSGQDVVEVAIGFKANKLIVFDQNERTVTWAGYIRRYWYDPRLAYNGSALEAPVPSINDSRSDNETTEEERVAVAERSAQGSRKTTHWQSQSFVRIDPEEIWRPDITVSNAVDFNWDELCEQTDAFLYDEAGIQLATVSEGNRSQSMRYNVLWSQPCVVKAKCDVDLKMFPFDTTVCPVMFQPWGDNFLKMAVATGSIENEVTIPEFYVTVVGATADRVSYSSMQGASWPRVSIDLQIARHAHYYVVNFICPMMLMVMLTWISFWIPANTSDRIQYMVTIVLTVMAVNFITAEKRPATDDDTWLDNFQCRTLLLVVFTTFYTVWFYCWFPSDEWPAAERERRIALLQVIDKTIRAAFPVICFLWLGRLFFILYDKGVLDLKYMSHFDGEAAREVFVGLFLMSLLMCLGTFARMHEIFEVRRFLRESGSGRARTRLRIKRLWCNDEKSCA
eukprot:TRINITY_DN13583_c0_g1_i5.p1 TRINITY_DN13583_c0_g1~~TRINITY_DN13583_c0_g1_i5.p1  ORF type:complete len:576 (+),score=59.60 TRINITY_DN13583_c0_g1_i5:71-1798(+)